MSTFDENVTRIQMYGYSGNMAGVIPKEEAEEMVKSGKWKVCNGVAIYPKVN